MLAELTADQIADLEALIGAWTPLLAIVLPFVLGLAVRWDVLPEVKKGVAVGGALLVALVSLAGEDWSQVTFEVFAARAALAWSIAEAAYRLMDSLVRQFSPEGLNSKLAPRLSLVPGLPRDPERTDRLAGMRRAA